MVLLKVAELFADSESVFLRLCLPFKIDRELASGPHQVMFPVPLPKCVVINIQFEHES